MKPLHFAFAALLSTLCACSSISEPVNPPTPAEHFQGPWLIRQMDDQGKVSKEWEVKSYHYSMFDRSVEFKDSSGNTVRLTSSFQIVQKP